MVTSNDTFINYFYFKMLWVRWLKTGFKKI